MRSGSGTRTSLAGRRPDGRGSNGRGTAICRRRSAGSIGVDDAQRVAQLAREVGERMGAPQDIEWALAGDELYLLQSRPITALPDKVEWKSPLPGGYFRHFRF